MINIHDFHYTVYIHVYCFHSYQHRNMQLRQNYTTNVERNKQLKIQEQLKIQDDAETYQQ